jgi:hypothetical protein
LETCQVFGLPPRFKRFVLLSPGYMLHQLVTFKPNQPAVGDFSFQLAVFDGGIQFLFIRFYKRFTALFGQMAEIQLFIKIFWLNSLLIQAGKDHPVGQDRFKNFGKVERQGKPSVSGFMQEGDQR